MGSDNTGDARAGGLGGGGGSGGTAPPQSPSLRLHRPGKFLVDNDGEGLAQPTEAGTYTGTLFAQSTQNER